MNSPSVPRGRYVLRLVDPLLPKPLYLDLNRSPITIGFHEGDDADAVIPWEKMRLILNQGEDEAGNPIMREVPLSCSMFICEPLSIRLTKKFNTWECTPVPRVALRLDYEDGFWRSTPGPNVNLNKGSYLDQGRKAPSVLKHLDEMNAFELHFSCCDEDETSCPMRTYDQILRFTLVDKEHTALENVRQGLSSPLLSLPTEILRKVLSDLNGKDLLNFLVVQPSMQPDVCFKPKFLKFTPSLDSIRLCLLASRNSVEEINCFDTATFPANLKNVVHSACWKKNLSSNRLKKLTIHDLSILKGVHLSSTLTTLCIEGTVFGPPLETRKRDLTGISLPASVTNVSLNFGSASCGDFKSDEGEIATGIFHLLPALKTLTMDTCPSEDFWRNVPTSVLKNIEHLCVRWMTDTSYFPLSLASNLKTLVLGDHHKHFKKMLRRTQSLPFLTALSLPLSSIQTLTSILNSSSFAAPELKYVSFGSLPCITVLEADFLAKFVYFRVRDHVGWENLIAFRQMITRVKCFEFTIKTLSAADKDQNLLSLRHEVEKVGGRVEILACDVYQFHERYWTKYKVHVRVFCDPSFDFEKLSREHPLLFEAGLFYEL